MQFQGVLQELLNERKEWLKRKDVAPLLAQIQSLKPYTLKNFFMDESVGFEDENLDSLVCDLAKALKPWRKGPFFVGNFQIDSEWVSSIKYALLEPHLDLKGKRVGDVGCNNGYYLFRMLKHEPRELIGFDPSTLAYLQFLFINHFLHAPIQFELLGLEHLPLYPPFEVLFCLGVLYHRSDPIGSLKILKNALCKNGVLFLDTLMIDSEDEIALTPKHRYAKMKNVYFIPSPKALEGWLFRAGFKSVTILAQTQTTLKEQRVSEWSNEESLGNFLDPLNSSLTIEGYPAPKRIYIKATY